MLTTLTSCKFGLEPSSVKDLRPGLKVGNDLSRDPNKPQILIYYANNPVETKSYKSEKSKILASFDEAQKDKTIPQTSLLSSRSSFESDANTFGDAVAVDIFGITNSICSENATVGAGAIIITNQGIVDNNIKYCNIKGNLQTLASSELKKFTDLYARIKSNPIHEHSPLAHPDMLALSLDVVKSVFPTEKFEYSIVLKSHGSESLTITPKVAYEARIITPAFLKDRFARKKISPQRVFGNGLLLDKDGLEKDGLDKDGLDKDGLDKDGLDKDGLDKDGLDKDGLDKDGLDKIGLEKDGLDKEGLDAAGLMRGENPAGAVAAGVTKFQMMSTLLSTNRDLFYNVVFMESCKSDLGALLQDLAEVPSPNIGYLYGSDQKGLSYNTVDWRSLQSSGATSLRDWLIQELDKKAGKSAH
jgi:pentapeptide MXKDX repeat protein